MGQNSQRIKIKDNVYGIDDNNDFESNHHFLQWDAIKLGVITLVTESLATHYFKDLNLPISKVKKETNRVRIQYTSPSGNIVASTPLNYKIIRDSIKEKGYFEPSEWNLPIYQCFWLDDSIDGKSEFLTFDDANLVYIRDVTPKKKYGSDFPILPAIDREGYLITTFTPHLTRQILSKRKMLVETSNNIFEFEWLFELKNLINDTISLLDITLLQIYTKAQFSPLPSWKIINLKI